MLRLMLKIRYGKNAKTIDRFMEFIAAVYFLILAFSAPPSITVAAAMVMMLIFCYGIGKQTWRVFAVPPLSVPHRRLAKSLFISSMVSAPMVAGIVISVISLNAWIIVVMVTTSAVACGALGYFRCTDRNQPVREIYRILPSAKTKLGQYLLLDWQRRRSRWLPRIIMPFICYPLMGIVGAQLLAFRSSDQLSFSAIPTGTALGLICSLMYIYTDDEPSNFLQTLTDIAFFWKTLPQWVAIIFAASLSYLLTSSLAQIVALAAALLCALSLAKTKSIISDHSAPVHQTTTVAQPTTIPDVMGIILIFAVYSGVYIAITLV